MKMGCHSQANGLVGGSAEVCGLYVYIRDQSKLNMNWEEKMNIISFSSLSFPV